MPRRDPNERSDMPSRKPKERESGLFARLSRMLSCCVVDGAQEVEYDEYEPRRGDRDSVVTNGPWCGAGGDQSDYGLMDIFFSTQSGEPTRPCCKGKNCHNHKEEPQVRSIPREAPREREQHAIPSPRAEPACHACNDAPGFIQCPNRHVQQLPSITPALYPPQHAYQQPQQQYRSVSSRFLPSPSPSPSVARSNAPPPLQEPVQRGDGSRPQTPQSSYRVVSCTPRESPRDPGYNERYEQDRYAQERYEQERYAQERYEQERHVQPVQERYEQERYVQERYAPSAHSPPLSLPPPPDRHWHHTPQAVGHTHQQDYTYTTQAGHVHTDSCGQSPIARHQGHGFRISQEPGGSEGHFRQQTAPSYYQYGQSPTAFVPMTRFSQSPVGNWNRLSGQGYGIGPDPGAYESHFREQAIPRAQAYHATSAQSPSLPTVSRLR